MPLPETRWAATDSGHSGLRTVEAPGVPGAAQLVFAPDQEVDRAAGLDVVLGEELRGGGRGVGGGVGGDREHGAFARSQFGGDAVEEAAELLAAAAEEDDRVGLAAERGRVEGLAAARFGEAHARRRGARFGGRRRFGEVAFDPFLALRRDHLGFLAAGNVDHAGDHEPREDRQGDRQEGDPVAAALGIFVHVPILLDMLIRHDRRPRASMAIAVRSLKARLVQVAVFIADNDPRTALPPEGGRPVAEVRR